MSGPCVAHGFVILSAGRVGLCCLKHVLTTRGRVLAMIDLAATICGQCLTKLGRRPCCAHSLTMFDHVSPMQHVLMISWPCHNRIRQCFTLLYRCGPCLEDVWSMCVPRFDNASTKQIQTWSKTCSNMGKPWLEQGQTCGPVVFRTLSTDGQPCPETGVSRSECGPKMVDTWSNIVMTWLTPLWP